MTFGTEMTPATARRKRRETASRAVQKADAAPHAPTTGAPRWSRRRGVLSVFAAFCALGFVGAYVGPTGMALAEAAEEPTVSIYASALDEAQTLETSSEAAPAAASLQRTSYDVYVKPTPTPTPVAPPPSSESESSSSGSGQSGGGSPAPLLFTGGGSPAEWMAAAGIAEGDWGYVDYIVSRESSWNPNATNSSSGACGLVQALPCSKVPGNGYDPVDNLRWANGYAVDRYGSWANAYSFWTSNHWW